MAIIKCKMCGGDLALTPGSTVAECEYCGSLQTVPVADNDRKLNLFARANRLRAACDFDKAAGIYESIVADFPEEAEAYWGLVLCKFGIEYVTDPATGKKIPTCHRSSFESVMKDPDLDQAMENADTVARKLYREEAKQIEQIRKEIIEVSGKEAPYDIFICYKERDEKGNRTLDSVLAQDIYDAVTAKGYRTFFARITLEDKLGQEYEPYIFAALNSAKVMLAVGTDYEYYNAVWVKNEWSRYLKLMTKDKEKHLIPCYKGIDAYDMPEEFAKLQAQDLGKIGATQDLLRGIEKLIPKEKAAPVYDQTDLYNKTLQEELARKRAIQAADDEFQAEQAKKAEERRIRQEQARIKHLQEMEEARIERERLEAEAEQERQRQEAEQALRNRRDSYYKGLRRNKRLILINTLIVGAVVAFLIFYSKPTLEDLTAQPLVTFWLYVAPILLPGLVLWYDGRAKALMKIFQVLLWICILVAAGLCAIILIFTLFALLFGQSIDLDAMLIMGSLIVMYGSALLFTMGREDLVTPTRQEKKQWKQLPRK